MSRSRLRILFAAAEVSPLAKVGGLADVVGSLPKALTSLGHQVRVVMPGYGLIDEQAHPTSPVGKGFTVTAMRQQETVTLKATTLNGHLPVYLVENKTYFSRPVVYGEDNDLERFLFFCRAVLALPEQLGWQPDIIHCHDWHTALVPMWARFGHLPATTVFTIHNLAYQGAFDYPFMVYSGLREDYLRSQGQTPSLPLNMMALGILHADVVTTVSQNYAREILTPEYGEGLDTLLRHRQDRLFGIVNGLDYSEFNPTTDTHLPANYDSSTLKGKAINKAALQQRVGLPQAPDIPLVGMVSRLDEQKGFDLLEKAIGPILEETPVQMVVLGRGREIYHQLMSQVASRYPSRVAVVIAFDNPLAHLIYAGADLFLMPSRFEPCGLGQLIAMRYGTIPIVRRTGGLAETVADLSADLAEGRGIVFDAYEAPALVAAVKRAAAAFSQRRAWKQLVARAMGLDFSWEASARKYVEVYEKAIEWRRARTR